MALISQQPIGESPEFHALMDRVTDVASLGRAVLLVGERGTGKELIASRLHFLSPRWEQVYVSLNCAAYSEAELEAHLFGCAYYDGRPDIESVFIKADGGTLFLDHIDTLGSRLQEKLLQLIERGAVADEADENLRDVDVRLISAASANLPDLARHDKFRPDLLSSLSFTVLGLPPLRGRPEDIPPLSEHFGKKIVAKLGATRFPGLTAEAMAVLMRQSWPGNVRELRAVVERSVAQAYLEDEDLLQPITKLVLDPFAGEVREEVELTAQDMLPAGDAVVVTAASETADFNARVMIFERSLIDEALMRFQNHQGRAAEFLGLSYHQFRGLLRKHGLKK